MKVFYIEEFYRLKPNKSSSDCVCKGSVLKEKASKQPTTKNQTCKNKAHHIT